jgi:hypothetical protein
MMDDPQFAKANEVVREHLPSPSQEAFGDRRARQLAWLSLALALPVLFGVLSLMSVLFPSGSAVGKNPVVNGETCTVSGTVDFRFQAEDEPEKAAPPGGGAGDKRRSTGTGKATPVGDRKHHILTADETKSLADEVRVDGLAGLVVTPVVVTAGPKRRTTDPVLGTDKTATVVYPNTYEIEGSWRLTPPAECPQGRHEVRLTFPAVARCRDRLKARTPEGDVTIRLELFTYPTRQARLFYPAAVWAEHLVLAFAAFVATACVTYGIISDWFGAVVGIAFRSLRLLSAFIFLGCLFILIYAAGGVITDYADGIGHLWQSDPAIGFAMCATLNLLVLAGTRLTTGEFRWSMAWAVAVAPFVVVLGGLTAAFWLAQVGGYDMSWRTPFTLAAASTLPGAVLGCAVALAQARPVADAEM